MTYNFYRNAMNEIPLSFILSKEEIKGSKDG